MIYSTYQPIFFETKENKCSGKMLDANNQKNLVNFFFCIWGSVIHAREEKKLFCFQLLFVAGKCSEKRS